MKERVNFLSHFEADTSYLSFREFVWEQIFHGWRRAWLERVKVTRRCSDHHLPFWNTMKAWNRNRTLMLKKVLFSLRKSASAFSFLGMMSLSVTRRATEWRTRVTIPLLPTCIQRRLIMALYYIGELLDGRVILEFGLLKTGNQHLWLWKNSFWSAWQCWLSIQSSWTTGTCHPKREVLLKGRYCWFGSVRLGFCGVGALGDVRGWQNVAGLLHVQGLRLSCRSYLRNRNMICGADPRLQVDFSVYRSQTVLRNAIQTEWTIRCGQIVTQSLPSRVN